MLSNSTDLKMKALEESNKRKEEVQQKRRKDLEEVRLQFKNALISLGIHVEPEISDNVNTLTVFKQVMIDGIVFDYRSPTKSPTNCAFCGQYLPCYGGLHARIGGDFSYRQINNLADLGDLLHNYDSSLKKKSKRKFW